MKTYNKLTLILMAIFSCLLIVMIVQLFPMLEDIVTGHGDESSIVSYIQSFGWRGVPALIGLSALQVIIPFIPVPVVGVLTGLSYGVYWGPIILLTGIAIGNLFVVVSIRQLSGLWSSKAKHSPKGGSEHKKLLSTERLDTLKRPEIFVFLLYLIPFLSGVGPYLFAKTHIPLGKYVIAVIAANIPSAIMYAFLGDHISRGNYTIAIVLAVILVIAVLIMLPFRKKIMDKIMSTSSL